MVAPWTLLPVTLLTGRHSGSLIHRKQCGSLGFLPPTREDSNQPAISSYSTFSSWGLPRNGFSLLQSDRLGPDERLEEGGGGAAAAEEETLLCANLTVKPGVTTDDALAAVSRFCQGFPFAAVLPVQPLHYLPLDGTGVEVKFLRKKTDIKSGVDGGIRFYVRVKDDDEDDDTAALEDEVADAAPSSFAEDGSSSKVMDEASSSPAAVGDAALLDDETSSSNKVIEITAKRNSQGQVIQKLMSEKLIITRFVAELQHDQFSTLPGNSVKTMPARPLEDMVTLTSVYHKWM
jgi:hypothetical protein